MTHPTYPEKIRNLCGVFTLAKYGPLHATECSCCHASIDPDALIYVSDETHDISCFPDLGPVTMHAECMDTAVAQAKK